jgi:hypothetical protein
MDARQHIIKEGIAEQVQIFGAEMPDRQWILSGWDTWERNPYYHGEEQQHPEDDMPHEEWLEHQEWLANMKKEVRVEKVEEVGNDDCPF